MERDYDMAIDGVRERESDVDRERVNNIERQSGI